MSAIRILLISHILTGLLVSSPACDSVKYCVPFMGENCCIKSDYTEPDLPPIDNDCCGPHCRYTALNGATESNSDVIRGRCLLDPHCKGNITFTYVMMSDLTLQQNNAVRASNGEARLLSFPWTEDTCVAQNTKCGINCCCRETCPTKFCVIKNGTTCP
ncbi:hypothetical protein KR059_004187 [Drosophila kikkawai]|nr:hypothetical protein KR059_004187 [Drosophila kikkawai]